MAKVKLKIKNKIIATVVAVLVALGAGVAVLVPVLTGGEAEVEVDTAGPSITYSAESVDAVVVVEDSESGQGEVIEEVQEDIPTVESVDAGTPVVDTESDEVSAASNATSGACPEGEECGLGTYIYAPTDTWLNFKNYTLGNCYNTDGAYGSQCWDLADLFWQNYAGRRASTCGSGAAKGMVADGCWQKNAGGEFEMVWDATSLQAGDWVVFNNGTYGHIGMAVGNYNNGYITLLGQNQGGASCPGGGAAANVINISLKYFAGAFRPKSYIVPDPEPTPEPTPTPTAETYTVKKADTLGAIALKLGWYPSVKGLFGDDGYTQKLAEANGISDRGLIYPGQTITRVEE